MDYLSYLEPSLLKDLQRFLRKVNERTEKTFGLRDEYDAEGEAALGEEVEYFHHCITCDDRMRYIMEHIVTLPDAVLSPRNKVCNTIISHFYGARGIHSVLTGVKDPKRAHVDFEAIANGDRRYTDDLRAEALSAQERGKKFYGTTELHTSLQTAARNFCRGKYRDPNRPASVVDIVEWIASWVADGTVDKILTQVSTLEEMYTFLRTKPGVGEYYGYHCATSNSVNPALPFDHDERFCAPGPGARATLDVLFAPLKQVTPKLPYDQLIIALREHQSQLFDKAAITPHREFWNFKTAAGLVFKEDQNELKTYGTEVGCCQFSVFLRLRAHPELIAKRKVARAVADDAPAVCVLEF